MEQAKICKHYVQGKCKKSDNCDFTHIDNICRFHFFGTCKHGDSCTHSHAHELNGQPNLNEQSNPNSKHKKKLVKKNTESFEPFDSSADMRVMIGNPLDSTYAHDYQSKDIILVHELFNTADYSNGNLFDKLLEEVNLFGDQLKNQDIWIDSNSCIFGIHVTLH